MSKANPGSIPILLHQNISTVDKSPDITEKFQCQCFKRTLECVSEGKGYKNHVLQVKMKGMEHFIFENFIRKWSLLQI